MNSPRSLVWCSLAALLLAAPLVAQAGPPGDGAEVTLYWPSEQYRTLQSAVDAAPDGATIRIPAGTYSVAAPVTIAGKRLTIKGAGSGRRGGKEATHLTGPTPRPVLDARGNVVLPAEGVLGMFNVSAGGARFERLAFSGFDAGVVAHGDERVSLHVEDVHIAHTGRGVLRRASGDTKLLHTTVELTLWHAIAMVPPQISVPEGWKEPAVWMIDSQVASAHGIGILLGNTQAFLANVLVQNNHRGGVVAVETLGVQIAWSSIDNNGIAGVWLERAAGYNAIVDTDVLHTHADPEGLFGDGIVVRLGSGVAVLDSKVSLAERAGLSNLGSRVFLESTDFNCTAFALNGDEVSFGFENTIPYEFFDLGGNRCYECGQLQPAACVAVSANLEPPSPIDEL